MSNIDQLLKSIDNFVKEANPKEFKNLIRNYEQTSEALDAFIIGLRASAEEYKAEADMADPTQAKIYELILLQADAIEGSLDNVIKIDNEINKLNGYDPAEDEENLLS